MKIVPTMTSAMIETEGEGMGLEVYDGGKIVLYPTISGGWEAKDSDGKGLCSGLDKESVLFWARNHLFGPLPGVTTIETKVKFTGQDTL